MEPPDALRSTWKALGIDERAFAVEADGTIRATVDSVEPSSERRRPAKAPQSKPPSSADLLLGDVLGEGGMGTVWLARQTSLDREVAVKAARGDLSLSLRKQLLREARVTGALEHPNIVPVHALLESESEPPLMVMKRVEGTAWSERLLGAEGELDELDSHLRILLQVCHAVHFAHTRGVLHRDLKPQNVMLGEFGEVYVVDWGTAVALRDDVSIRGLPLAAKSNGVIGTLQYMAPEMAGGKGADLDERTDVYLLGAILHELLTGDPPHLGDTVEQLLVRAWQAKPYEYEPQIPAELAGLCKRALARDKSARPASADAFRQEISDFLEHRSSVLLSDEATQRLFIAQHRREQGADPLPALNEARFAFRQALRIWPSNKDARAGLQEALELMLRVAIEDESVLIAKGLLDEMPAQERSRFEAEVEELRLRVEGREAHMKALQNEVIAADLGVAAKERKRYGIAFGVLFVCLNIGLDLYDRISGPLSPEIFLGATSLLAIMFAVPALVRHRRVFPNRATQRLAWGIGLMLLGQTLLYLALVHFDVPMRQALTITLYPLAMAIAISNALLEPRMWWSAAVALCAALAATADPNLVLYGVGVGYGAFFVGGGLLRYGEQDRVSRP